MTLTPTKRFVAVVAVLVATNSTATGMLDALGLICSIALVWWIALRCDPLIDELLRRSIQPVSRFVREDDGQDLIEYGLLAAFIGTVGIVAWMNIQNQIGLHYAGWGTSVGSLSRCTPDPVLLGGGGCGGGS